MKMDWYFMVQAIVFGMVEICALAVGLWGLTTQRPFLIWARSRSSRASTVSC